jgi:hypothetical protein
LLILLVLLLQQEFMHLQEDLKQHFMHKHFLVDYKINKVLYGNINYLKVNIFLINKLELKNYIFLIVEDVE